MKDLILPPVCYGYQTKFVTLSEKHRSRFRVRYKVLTAVFVRKYIMNFTQQKHFQYKI